ncbi:galactokinase [Aeromicrobium sp. Leaf350]|uniref:galactokinase n=1 Tax=Aeromicrobium sp. Leaf350 TaxID=2876565 RepID=UPI001E42ED48|nr:galactokinase [Aeromicrobium sp. Leaf350]
MVNTVAGAAVGIKQWHVPGRVNLIGEHLDHNGGLTLPFAIDRGTTVKVRRRDDDRVAVWSGGERADFATSVVPGEVDGWAAYVAGVVWALGQAGHRVPGADVVVESTLPQGAGLASSAALTCGVALGLADVAGLGLDRAVVAAVAQHAESGFVGVPVGRMDQLAVLLGQAGHAVLIDHRPDPPTTTDVVLDPGADGLALALIDTRVHHALAAGEYAARREECGAAAAELGLEHLAAAPVDAVFRLSDPTLVKRTRHVITETTRVRGAVKALSIGAWSQLGGMLTSSHESLRDDFEVSCPELDLAVEVALEHGALGARLTGGGFGGSVVALVPADRAAAMATAVKEAFVGRTWAAPVVAPVRPSAGARLVP